MSIPFPFNVLAGILAAMTASGPVEPPPASIRLDQNGVETDGAKVAVIATDATQPQRWILRDSAGRVVARGRTQPFGADAASGERLQRIDFSAFRMSGEGYRLAVGDADSHPFVIRARPYARLATAALGFFYQQRSGVPILRAHVERPDLARAAGQPGERVTCFDGPDERGVRWPGCAYSLTTAGGWYDAGDHGKYVVNGGIAAWTLLDLHERLRAWGAGQAFADGTLPIPERANGADDLLDEARVEVGFLLAMQAPPGARAAVPTEANGTPAIIDVGGMAHTKVADERWTGLPTTPADDPMRRFLYPPSTAATLNLAAVAAQAARVWRTVDPAFAARALQAATRAWDAAERNPAILASSTFTGSGGYGDPDPSDERFWAAAELLATTGDARYLPAVESSSFLTHPGRELNWGRLDLAALMTLATQGNGVPASTRGAARTAILKVAAGYLAEQKHSGYRLPFASAAYVWGSNAGLLNRAMVLGVAWQIGGDPSCRVAAGDVVAYLLGRNPLDQSYVTGFGARRVHQPHHRFWAHAADPRYPEPPSGVLVGGPNSTAMSDPIASPMKGRCTGQTCWVDDWRAYAMNEVAINWNAPLVWVAAFLDATRTGVTAGRTPTRAGGVPRR